MAVNQRIQRCLSYEIAGEGAVVDKGFAPGKGQWLWGSLKLTWAPRTEEGPLDRYAEFPEFF